MRDTPKTRIKRRRQRGHAFGLLAKHARARIGDEDEFWLCGESRAQRRRHRDREVAKQMLRMEIENSLEPRRFRSKTSSPG